MKRLFALAAVVLIIAALAACGGDTAETQPAVTEAPTDAPYIDTQLSEPEWTYAEGTLQLLSADNTVLASGKEDILYFAIVTDKDGSQELRFKLSDAVAAKLKDQSADATYTMTLNNEMIGTAKLNSDGTEAVITADNTVGDITQVASKIRGLA